jgi:hypothetical protein
MAKKGRMGVLKRQRELRKAEKAALKAERKKQKSDETESSTPTREDLESYGLITEEPSDSEEQ